MLVHYFHKFLLRTENILPLPSINSSIPPLRLQIAHSEFDAKFSTLLQFRIRLKRHQKPEIHMRRVGGFVKGISLIPFTRISGCRVM